MVHSHSGLANLSRSFRARGRQSGALLFVALTLCALSPAVSQHGHLDVHGGNSHVLRIGWIIHKYYLLRGIHNNFESANAFCVYYALQPCIYKYYKISRSITVYIKLNFPGYDINQMTSPGNEKEYVEDL